MAVDDRLRQPGRARRVQHPQRVIERARARIAAARSGPASRSSQRQLARAAADGVAVEIRDQDRPLQRRQLGSQLGR